MMKRCSSCGKEGEEGKKYCSHCGGLLVDPKIPESRPSPALGSLFGNESSKQQEKTAGCFALFVKIPFFAVLLSPVAALVLCLIPPKHNEGKAVNIPTPRLTMQRVLAYSRIGPVVVNEDLINAFLKETPYSLWKPSFDFLPAPELKGTHVGIQSGEFTYSLQLAYFGYPVTFSETYRVVGSSQKWALEPVSGTIGRLLIPKDFVTYLSRVTTANLPHVEEELKVLASAKSLQLMPGKIAFSGR